jgi:hypothetical protein
MTTGPPGPGEPPWRDDAAGRRASLTALWALALERFRDYLHWTTGPAGRHPAGEAAGGSCADEGDAHDRDP